MYKLGTATRLMIILLLRLSLVILFLGLVEGAGSLGGDDGMGVQGRSEV
jgi:hypothetical protein